MLNKYSEFILISTFFSAPRLHVASEVELCFHGNRCCENAWISVGECEGRLSCSLTQIYTRFHGKSWWSRPPTWSMTWSGLTANISVTTLWPLDSAPTCPPAHRSHGTSSCGASCCSSGWIGCCTAHTWRASSPCVWPYGPAERSSDWRPCHTDCTWRAARLRNRHSRWVWTQWSHDSHLHFSSSDCLICAIQNY